MTAKELTNYKPYTIARYHEGYADIAFQDEGVMTVPKNSAQAIVDFMNEAFRNGVKMGLKQSQMVQTGSINMETPVIAKKMPEEELHPIYTYKKH